MIFTKSSVPLGLSSPRKYEARAPHLLQSGSRAGPYSIIEHYLSKGREDVWQRKGNPGDDTNVVIFMESSVPHDLSSYRWNKVELCTCSEVA